MEKLGCSVLNESLISYLRTTWTGTPWQSISFNYSIPHYFDAGLSKLFGRSGGMKHELKKIMFSGSDTPIPLSFDSAKFCVVMSVFHNYERQVRHWDNIISCAMLRIVGE